MGQVMDIDSLDDAQFEALLCGLAVHVPELMGWTELGDGGTALEIRGRKYSRDELVRPKEAMLALGIKRATLYRWIGDGVMPRPRKLSARTTGWPAFELRDWMHDRQRTEQGNVA